LACYWHLLRERWLQD